MIPEMTLNQIQDRVDIVELIGGFVPLRRAGRSFKANCPFHHEKTPSFIVNPDKQIFHCFGCGVGGNVFSFLMKYEKKDFREVVEALAEQVGVEIPKDRTFSPAVQEKNNFLAQAMRLAAEFYHQFLLSREEASRARAYLKKRGLSDETVKNFQIGFAPGSWDALTNALQSKIPEAILEKAGLVIARKEGGYYDRFRDRILFPILDPKGACVAFGGRVLDDSLPKYLNSPETEIYSKGRNLYGLFQARQAIREKDQVIVVEGYLDLAACHQAGVKNSVASLGTALTPEQVRLVKRHTKNALILYDADKAGEMATLRGLEIFLAEGMEVKIVRLPEGHDPDSFVQERGAEAFERALNEAKTLFDYKLALLKEQFDPQSVEGKVKIANDMVSLFSKVPNEILKSAWLKELAGQLRLSEQALTAEMRKTKEAASRVLREETPAKWTASESMRPVERLLLGLMLESAEFVARTRKEVLPEDFENRSGREIVRRLFDMEERHSAVSAAQLINFYKDDAESARIVSMACAEADSVVEKVRAFEDCLLWMKRLRVHHEREELRSQILAAQNSGDQNRISRLLYDLNELNKGIKKINEKK